MPYSPLVWKLVGVVTTVVTIALPVYVAVDLWRRGPTPTKSVELTRFAPINPLSDLSSLGESATLAVSVGQQTVSNLHIAQAFLKNTGLAPIVPSDFTQPLRVRVKPPWKIVAVADDQTQSSSFVSFRWKRLDEVSFEAEPALLNPGDSTRTFVNRTGIRGGRLA